MKREELLSLLNESFVEVIQDNKRKYANYKQLKEMYKISINEYSLWKYEVSEVALEEKNLLVFINAIDKYPIEKLISGQPYHNRDKTLISITVKPIKTTFIIPYRKTVEGSMLFPCLKQKSCLTNSS